MKRSRRFLIYGHRWLGISGCVLFVAWFASGIVMMYVRMPEVTAADRIARLEPLDLSAGRVSPADVAGADVERVRINMLAGRPVYRFAPGGAGGSRSVYADSGEALTPITPDQALDLARQFAPEQAATLSYASFLSEPDQWTLSGDARQAMPLHRIALGDSDGTDAYYYDRTHALNLPVLRVRYLDPQQTWLYLDPRRGSIVRKEERLSRANRWLYHGLHSLDFPILSTRRPLWDIVVIALSLGGLVVSATTLVPAGHRLKRHWRRLGSPDSPCAQSARS